MDFKLQIESRSFGGKKFRPTPACHDDRDTGLFICVTPWGSANVSEVVIESIKNFFSVANQDTEVTVPYEKKPNLDRYGNMLRMAIIMASEKVHRDFNSKSYSAGFEIFAGLVLNDQWTYVCCGQPSLFLLRDSLGVMPIHNSLDLNVQISSKILSDPLPSHLLGMGQRPPIHFGSQVLQKQDRFALISRSYVPNNFFVMPNKDKNLDSISSILANDNPDIPNWIGLISFD